MKCLDLEQENILSLMPDQQRHLDSCPKCRLAWEDRALEREIINAPFDPSKEPVVDLTGKPPTTEWITPAFRQMLQAAKEEQLAAREGSLDRVNALLQKLYPANLALRRKLSGIAEKLSSKLHPAPADFNERFVAALGMFPEEKAEKMQNAELVNELKKKIGSSD